MKTSVIEVHDMLSVLSVEGVEDRIGSVPGVESVTVNFSAGSATVRYDETRLEVSDIKAGVRQRAYEDSNTPSPGYEGKPRGANKPAAVPTPDVAHSSESKATAPEPKAESVGNEPSVAGEVKHVDSDSGHGAATSTSPASPAPPKAGDSSKLTGAKSEVESPIPAPQPSAPAKGPSDRPPPPRTRDWIAAVPKNSP